MLSNLRSNDLQYAIWNLLFSEELRYMDVIHDALNGHHVGKLRRPSVVGAHREVARPKVRPIMFDEARLQYFQYSDERICTDSERCVM